MLAQNSANKEVIVINEQIAEKDKKIKSQQAVIDQLAREVKA